MPVNTDLEPQTKRFTLADFAWKADAPEGTFSATFATLNVIDHHGDVLLPGLIDEGKTVPVGGYQHDMMSLPVGKAVMHSDANRVWIDGEFNLATQIGRDTYETVKALQDVLEWSFVFTVQAADFGPFDTGAGVVDVRYLKKLDVWSVDPVLRGAGIGTRTDAIKSLSPSFATHADELGTALGAFVDRAEARCEMRAKSGRDLSADDRERLTALVTGLVEAQKRIEAALGGEADEPAEQNSNDDHIDLSAEFMRYQRSLAVLNGVALAS